MVSAAGFSSMGAAMELMLSSMRCCCDICSIAAMAAGPVTAGGGCSRWVRWISWVAAWFDESISAARRKLVIAPPKSPFCRRIRPRSTCWVAARKRMRSK